MTSSLNNDDSIKLYTDPVKSYNDTIHAAHEKIDQAFATNQAEFYTPEAKENHPSNNFTIGIIPLPGMLGGAFINISKFADAGRAIDRTGFTKAGRALMKHGYRGKTVFPKPFGNPTQVNAHGQIVLESILNHPEKVVYDRPHPDFGRVIDIVVPGKGGARFTTNGEMIGFLEP